jgi:hypothetical protein
VDAVQQYQSIEDLGLEKVFGEYLLQMKFEDQKVFI